MGTARLGLAMRGHAPLCHRSQHKTQSLHGSGVLQADWHSHPGSSVQPRLPGYGRVLEYGSRPPLPLPPATAGHGHGLANAALDAGLSRDWLCHLLAEPPKASPEPAQQHELSTKLPLSL